VDYLIYYYPTHFWEMIQKFVEVILRYVTNCTIWHYLDRIDRVAIEDNWYFTVHGSFFKDTKADALPWIKKSIYVTNTLSSEDNLSEWAVELFHDFLFWWVDINLNTHKNEVHLLFSASEDAHFTKDLVILNHENTVSQGWLNKLEKVLLFILTL